VFYGIIKKKERGIHSTRGTGETVKLWEENFLPFLLIVWLDYPNYAVAP
jgi:hypothetical protein